MAIPLRRDSESHTAHTLPGPVVKLTRGCLEAQLHPMLGARLGSLRRQGAAGESFDYLVPIDAANFDLGHWQRAGCFVMLPFTNKLPGNTLAWRDEIVRIAAPEAPGWLHGWGARSPWQVVEASLTHCVLGYAAAAMESWPWTYRANLHVALDPDGLSTYLEVLNLSPKPMPLGIGFHPYLSIAGELLATVDATAHWQASATSQGLPAIREALDAPLQIHLRHDALPDHTLTWFCETPSAQAVIDYPQAGRRMTLTSGEARHLVIHYRAGERFLCIEPCSHLAGTLDPVVNVALPGTPVRMGMRLKLE